MPAAQTLAQSLDQSDPEICNVIRQEARRQEDHVELIASENYTSRAVMAAQGSLIIYVVIIWYYARYMNNLDLEYGVHEGEEE